MTYSIIIPYKDIIDLVIRAVNSVPDRADIEIIVINNGTTDLPMSLFADRTNIRILSAAQGKGAGAARNVGIELAEGKWLLMLDADDFFTPDAFEIMDRYSSSEADIVFFYATGCDSDTLVPSDRHHETNELIDAYLQTGDEGGLRYGWSSPWAKMIKRSLVMEHAIRCDETQVANDVLFSVKTGYWAQKIEAVKDTVYCITTRQGSLTKTPSLKNLNERIDTSIRFNAFLKEHHIKNYRKSIMFLVRSIAHNYGYREALKAIKRSIQASNNPLTGITRWVKTAQKIKQHD